MWYYWLLMVRSFMDTTITTCNASVTCFHSKLNLLFIKLKIINTEEGKETGIRIWMGWNSEINAMQIVWKSNVCTGVDQNFQELSFIEILLCVITAMNRKKFLTDHNELKVSFSGDWKFLLTYKPCKNWCCSFMLRRALSFVTRGPFFKMCFLHRRNVQFN